MIIDLLKLSRIGANQLNSIHTTVKSKGIKEYKSKEPHPKDSHLKIKETLAHTDKKGPVQEIWQFKN